MRLAWMGGLAFLAAGVAYAAGVSPAGDQPEDICEEALEHLIKCDPAGFDVLKRHLCRTDYDKFVKFFRGQMAAAKETIESSGEPIGFELVRVRQVGGAVKRFTYLCKYQTGWIRWRFTFYKPDRHWMLYSFVYDENEEALFSDCGHDETLSDLRTARGGDSPKR